MPRVGTETLLVLDGAFQAIGAGAAVVYALRLYFTAPPRDPLRSLPPPSGNPDLVPLLAIIVGYVALATSGVYLSGIQTSSAAGSRDWHVLQFIDSVAKLAACVPMILLLRYAPLLPDSQFIRLARAAGVAFVAVLIATPICMSQLFLGAKLWLWAGFGAAPPSHPVVDAMESTVWGNWGRMQLAAGALLVAPLAEELFFRGMLLGVFYRAVRLPWLAAVSTAICFGLVHSSQPQDVLPLITFGLILSYLRLRHNSLALCVLAHSLFNLRTIALLLIDPQAARQAW